MKYGIKQICKFCTTEFETKKRFLEYCSTTCKNPINRPGNIAWNKGLKLSDEQKAKQNISGLEKGRGWNKGKDNPTARQRFLENNPNKDGRLNNLRLRKIPHTEYTAYISDCKKATYRTLYAMKRAGTAIKTGKRKTDMQLDHIIPYRQGFDLGISPAIIGGRKNLRYISGAENRKKWDTYQTADVISNILGDNYGL